MIKVTINNICAKLTECEPLVAGMIGNLVEVSFSAEWSGLNKIAVFSNGDVTKDLYESQWNGNYIPIPWEVLETPHRTISMGIYGYELVDGEKVLAIPTIVAEIGKTKFGADPSDDPAADPTLPIWAQLQWEIDHFEIPDEQIAIQVQAYLDEHPIEIQPATASVLGGIKVGEGLSVTADGTLSTEVTAEDIDDLADIVDGKQDEIADLDEIRAGAELGSTALQPSALNAYRTASAQDAIDATKQDVISDLATIRSGAALGATALQNADIYIPTGLDKTGATDMSTIIQSALNSGNVYLPVGTYRIDSTLSVIGKNFVCDGEIVANGCDAIKVTGEYSNVKIKKITAAGHTCVIIGGDRWTSDNVVDVEFAVGAIGFAVGSDTKNTQYSTIKFERITATQYGIYCWCGGGKYNNETLIYGGAIGGTASKGIYCLGAREVRVIFASIEGVVAAGTGIEFDNSSYNHILGLRTGEDYGLYAFSFKGSSSYNFINTHTLNLQDLDISTMSATAVGNVIRGKICSKLIEWEYIANEIYIDGYVGVSFVPLANVGASINSASISATTIDNVDYKVISYNKLDSIPKVINLVYGDSTQTNYMLGKEYYDEHSAYFGNSITFKAWAGNKPKFYDSDANLIADFSGGVDSDCKIVIRCVGYTESSSVYTPQWEVLTIGTNNNAAQLPKNVSAFNNDSGYLTLSTLPIYDGGVE